MLELFRVWAVGIRDVEGCSDVAGCLAVVGVVAGRWPPTGTLCILWPRTSVFAGGDVGLDDGPSKSMGLARSICLEYRRFAGTG